MDEQLKNAIEAEDSGLERTALVTGKKREHPPSTAQVQYTHYTAVSDITADNPASTGLQAYDMASSTKKLKGRLLGSVFCGRTDG